MAEPNGSPVTVGQLLAVLSRVRRHALLVWVTTLVLGTLGIAALLLVLALWLDQVLVLPAMVRAVLLLIVVGGPAWFGRWAWRRHPGGSVEDTALLIEHRYPSLDNALINSIQLSREMPEGCDDIVAAITNEAQQAVHSIRPSAAVSKRELSSALGVALVAVLLLIVHTVASAEGLGTGLHRVLAPFADNTLTRIVEVTPGEADVLKGEPVEVAVRVEGRVPTRAELVGVYPDGRAVRLGMAAPSPSNPERLTTQVERIEDNLRYHVAAGDDRSSTYELRVHEPPAVKRITQQIAPPEYIHGEPAQETGGTIRALAGSQVTLRVAATGPFEAATLALNDGREIAMTVRGVDDSAVGEATLEIATPGHYDLALTHPLGFTSEPVRHDILVEPDRSPQVSFAEPAEDARVSIDAQVRVRIEAGDDHALKEIALVQLDPEWRNLPEDERPEPEPITTWTFDDRATHQATREHTVSVAELGLDEETPVVLQAVAHDFNPRGEPGRSALRTLRLQAPRPDDEALGDEETYSHVSLEKLIELQRTNLAASRGFHEAQQAETEPEDDLPSILARQERILTDAMELAETTVGAAANNPFIQRRLRDLADTLMTAAVSQLQRVETTSQPTRVMAEAIATQKDILDQLIVADARQDSELAERRHREITEALAELIAKQEALREDTTTQANSPSALSARQRVLAREAGMVQRLMEREAKRGATGDEKLAEQYVAAAAAFDKRSVRENMIITVERLGGESFDSAASLQQQVLADLRAIEKLLRDMAMEDARDKMEDVAESLREAKDKVDRMVDVQEAVTEVAKDLKKRTDKRDGSTDAFNKDVKDLVEARENLRDAIEQLAKDLHIHPDTPVSNDMLTELSEIFEQVDQKAGSEDAPVSEMAVSRDEGTLEMLKKMQEEMEERMPDAEMWLPDTPENLRWQRENFDRDE
ncbi:MAG: hypothetical protein ACODAQ_10820, partial [Phycisphaeraceae bacterium]